MPIAAIKTSKQAWLSHHESSCGRLPVKCTSIQPFLSHNHGQWTIDRRLKQKPRFLSWLDHTKAVYQQSHSGYKDARGMICNNHNLLGIGTMMGVMNPSFSALIWQDHNHSPSAVPLQVLLQLVTGYTLRARCLFQYQLQYVTWLLKKNSCRKQQLHA